MSAPEHYRHTVMATVTGQPPPCATGRQRNAGVHQPPSAQQHVRDSEAARTSGSAALPSSPYLAPQTRSPIGQDSLYSAHPSHVGVEAPCMDTHTWPSTADGRAWLHLGLQDQAGSLTAEPSVPIWYNHPTTSETHGCPQVSVSTAVGAARTWLDEAGRSAPPTGQLHRQLLAETTGTAEGSIGDPDEVEIRPPRAPEKPEKPEKPKKARGQQTEERRLQTAMARFWRACCRCRAQKIRCKPNQERPKDPDAACQTCLDVHRSGKLIHAVPCVRARLNFLMSRIGMLGYTPRFDETWMHNIESPFTMYKVIHLYLGISHQQNPLHLMVKKFVPAEGDTTAKCWTVDGEMKHYEVAPYCLVDIFETQRYFVKYLRLHCFDGLRFVADHSEEPMVRKTLHMIYTQYYRLGQRIRAAQGASVRDQNAINGLELQHKVLRGAVFAWYAGRHSSGSAALLPTGHTLGMEPSYDASFPHKDAGGNNMLPVPRMICAQFDSIQYWLRVARIFEFVKQFESVLVSTNNAAFLTCHLIVFLFLHWTAVASRQRASRAERRLFETKGVQTTPYGERTRPMTRFVEEMHLGAVNLLRFWQYYKSDMDLRQVDWDGPKTPKKLAKLEPYERQFIRESAEMMRDKVDIPADLDHGRAVPHELYFVEKMYMARWYGFEIFRC